MEWIKKNTHTLHLSTHAFFSVSFHLKNHLEKTHLKYVYDGLQRKGGCVTGINANDPLRLSYCLLSLRQDAAIKTQFFYSSSFATSPLRKEQKKMFYWVASFRASFQSKSLIKLHEIEFFFVKYEKNMTRIINFYFTLLLRKSGGNRRGGCNVEYFFCSHSVPSLKSVKGSKRIKIYFSCFLWLH